MSKRLRGHGDRGQDLVEYALLLPVLLVFILGIIQFAIVIWTYDTLSHAAREGARVGIIPARTDEEVADAVLSRALGLDQDEISIVIERGDTVRVQVDYELSLIISPVVAALGGDSTLPLRSVATMRSE